MDKAVVLGAAEYLVCLLLADKAVRAGLAVGDGIVVEVHAHVLFEMAAALTHKAARAAAGAGADGDSRGIFNERAYLVVGGRTAVVLNSAHDGHDAHEEHTGLAGVKDGRDHVDTAAGVFLKAVAKVGVTVALLTVGENALHDAGDPDRIVVAVDAVHLAGAHDTGGNELVKLLLNEGFALLAALCNFAHRAVGLKAQVHHNAAHVVRHDGVEDPVLGVGVGNAGVGQGLKADLCSQLENVRSFCHHYTS